MQQRDLFCDALYSWCANWLGEQADLRPLQVATIASNVANYALTAINAETQRDD